MSSPTNNNYLVKGVPMFDYPLYCIGAIVAIILFPYALMFLSGLASMKDETHE